MRSRMSMAVVALAAGLTSLLGLAGTATADPAPTPPATAGLALWYDASSLPSADGQPVTSWPDRSGNGRTLTAFDSASAATMRTNAINGRAAVEFDGSHSLLKTYDNSFTLPTPTTFFIVYRSLDQDTAGARNFVFDSRDSLHRQVLGRPGPGAIRMYADLDMDFTGFTYPSPGYAIWSGTFNGSSSSLYQNGQLVGAGNAGSASLGGFSVGALSTSAQYGYDYSHALVAEILYYSGTMSAADRQATTDWLNQKYATTGPAVAPANTAAPSLSGTAAVGSTLTTTDGQWSGSQPLTFAYTWRRCDAQGANCSAIGGATASRYQLTTADVGFTVRSVVSAANSAGAATASAGASAVVVSGEPPPSERPPVTAGLQLWYAADSSGSANGEPVTRWRDESGNGRDLTAFDANAAPTMRQNAVNGRAAIEFNGSSSLLKTYESAFTFGQPDSYFIVYRQLDTREAYIFDSRDANVRQLLGQGPFSDMEMYANVDLIDTNLTWPFPGYEIWSGTFQGDASTLYRNGSLVAGGRTGSSGLAGFSVGALSTSAQYGYLHSHALVAEILYYDTALSDSQRAAVTDWLNNKYGILAPPTRPSNTALPTISGTTTSGHTLKAANGTWSGSQPLSYTYEWRRCEASGASCSAIPGATTADYALKDADVGSTIRLAVTAVNAAGEATAISDATGVVAASDGEAPPVTSGLELWYDASAESYANGAAVTTWSDHSSKGRDLTAADPGAAPTYRTGAVGGLPAVEFDGSRSLLKTYGSVFTLSQPTTFFIVYKQLDPASGTFVFDSRDSSARQLFGQNSTGKLDAYANNPISATATVPFADFEIWSGTFHGANSSLWRNGTQVAAGNAGGSGLSGLTVGALSTIGPYGYAYSHSQVAEILYYSGSLTDADRAAVTGWLAHRYGL